MVAVSSEAAFIQLHQDWFFLFNFSALTLSVTPPHSFIPQYIIRFAHYWLCLSEMDVDCSVHSLNTSCVPLDGVRSFHVCQAYKHSWVVLLLTVLDMMLPRSIWTLSDLGRSFFFLPFISSTPFLWPSIGIEFVERIWVKPGKGRVDIPRHYSGPQIWV